MKKRLGIYIFDNVEVIDWAGPTGVFAVARRMDPELETFLIGDTPSPVVATAGLRVMPKYGLADNPSMDAFLIPGGLGTRAELHNKRLLDFVKSLPAETLLVSVCTGSWVYGAAGLLDGIRATNRKNGDPNEPMVPIDRLAKLAPNCIIDRHRVVDSGRIITGGGITSGLEVGFHILKRFGYSSDFIDKVAYIMEYEQQWALMRNDLIEINE